MVEGMNCKNSIAGLGHPAFGAEIARYVLVGVAFIIADWRESRNAGGSA